MTHVWENFGQLQSTLRPLARPLHSAGWYLDLFFDSLAFPARHVVIDIYKRWPRERGESRLEPILQSFVDSQPGGLLRCRSSDCPYRYCMAVGPELAEILVYVLEFTRPTEDITASLEMELPHRRIIV